MVAVPEDLGGDFEQAYRAHRSTLARRARRYFPPDEADDAVQETFLRAWIHHGSRDPGLPWLLTVLRNLAIDRSRRRRADPVGDLTTLDSPVEGPDEKVIALEERRAVRNAIRGLTEGQRRAIHLREWRGFTHHRIADTLGTTVPSVESLLLRGRRRLRRTLEGVLGVALWPVLGTWRRFRHLLEGASTQAPATAPAFSATLAHLATAAVVITAGIAGGGIGRRGAEPLPGMPGGGESSDVALIATDGAERFRTIGAGGGSVGGGSVLGGSDGSAPATSTQPGTSDESLSEQPTNDSSGSSRLASPDASGTKGGSAEAPEGPSPGSSATSDTEPPSGSQAAGPSIKGATSTPTIGL